MPGGTTGYCATVATSRARFAARQRAIGIPSSWIDPVRGSTPPIARSSVDLPAPFGPITVTHSPGDVEVDAVQDLASRRG